ncbi:MAG TPA: glycosyltransferase family 2 protein [Nitrospirota bacterium]|nr:glycosyltransferase family 2 protein [Nitrospirota bacterium]
MRLTVIIPAFNEELSIENAVREMVSSLPIYVQEYELLIVDDGSTDRTGELLRQLAAGSANVRIITHGQNFGYGAALRSGFQHARMEWILFADADRQISIAELPAFLDASREHDLIIGYRTGRNDSVMRRILSWGYGWLISTVLGVKVRDINCPFKLFKRDLLAAHDLSSRGFLINAELLYQLKIVGKQPRELEVAFHERQKGVSTVRSRHVIETLKELILLLRKK